MTSTFSRADALRPIAERQIDERFSEAINRVIGPMGPLHFLKRQQAAGDGGALVDGDREAILARAADQDEALAALDRRRLTLKAGVRAATTAAEIKALLARLEEEAAL